jgi:hypothetical protein
VQISCENPCYIFWVCFSSLRYPIRKAHAPYRHLRHSWLCNIFPRYLTDGTISWGGGWLLNIKYLLWFSLKKILILRNILRNISIIINLNWSLCKVRARCWWRSWLRDCATNPKVAGSIPDSVIGIFYWHNLSGRTMALGVDSASNRNE